MTFLQTLAAAFKGGGDRVPLARNFTSPWVFADGGPSRAPFEYSSAVRRAYLDNPVAQRAVRLVAEGIGGAPLLPSDAKLLSLVAATSAGQSLLETLASHLLLHGNAYVQVLKDAKGDPVELFALRPERVSVAAGPDGWPTAFVYKVGERKLTIPVLDEDALPNLIHIRHFHPSDDHYGAGCLAAADQAVATHNAAANWNRALLENAARPSGALVYDAKDEVGLSAEQFDRLKAELAQAFSGQGNAGRPMLLEGGLTWQSMSLTPADMDFAALKAAAARDIALAFGVPPMLIGLPGDSTYANYREANRALWRLTLLPLGHKLLTALVEGLAGWFPDAKLAMDLLDATGRQLALGANRALLGSEILQFGRAVPLGSGRWRLEELLRGRGGTESAVGGHAGGEPFCLLDTKPVALDPALIGSAPGTSVVASGRGDPDPVASAIALQGITLRPLSPVHPRVEALEDGSVRLGWTRRARGAWLWSDGVDTPLHEQAELYEVAFGATAAPTALWSVSEPELVLSAQTLADLAAALPGGELRVRQQGSYALSEPLRLTSLS